MHIQHAKNKQRLFKIEAYQKLNVFLEKQNKKFERKIFMFSPKNIFTTK